jgi:hypothetical protein
MVLLISALLYLAVPLVGQSTNDNSDAGSVLSANNLSSGSVIVSGTLPSTAGNDSFATRIHLTGSYLVVTGSNFNATREAREPIHADFNLNAEPGFRIGKMRTGRSLWWSWTAPASGWVRINPEGSDFDPVVAVYQGDSIRRLKGVTLNRDPFWGHVGGVAEFHADAGTTYQIVVDGPPTGDWRHPVPAEGNVRFSLDLTTLELLHPGDGTIFNGITDLVMKVNTPAPEVDGYISEAMFHTRSYENEIIELGASCNSLEVAVTNMLPGYYILNARMTNHVGVERVSAPTAIAIRPANDNFSNSLTLHGYVATNSGYIGAATWEKSEKRISKGPPGSGSVWWSWTAPASGATRVVVYGGDVLTAWRGTSLRGLKQVAQSRHSEIVFQAKSGVRYHFSAAGFNQTFYNRIGWATHFYLSLKNVNLTAPAPSLVFNEPAVIPLAIRTTEPPDQIARVDYFAGGVLISSATHAPFDAVWSNATAWVHTIHAVVVKVSGEHLASDSVNVIVRPLNDNFSNAFALVGPDPVGRGTTISASAEPGEPIGQRTAWWRWTAPGSGRAILRNTGSGFLTTFKVYSGDSISNLVSVTDPSGTSGTIRSDDPGNEATFRAHEGETYAISAQGTGLVEFEVELVAPPTNDNFQQPLVVSGLNPTLNVYNFAATSEPGEPAHGDVVGSRSVWFSWTAPVNGSVRLYNRGYGYNMGIGFYSGSILSNLTHVASIPKTQQQVRFNVTAGETYKIAVGDQREGIWNIPVDINYEPAPPNDNFSQASPMFGSFLQGSILSAAREFGEPPHGGSTNGNSVWWSWTAAASGYFSVAIQYSDFVPRFALYSGNTVSELSQIATRTNHLSAYLTEGVSYKLAIENVDNRVGYYSLNLRLPTTSATFSPLLASITPELTPSTLRMHWTSAASSNDLRLSVLSLEGEPGQSFVLQNSEDLMHWTDMLQGIFTNQPHQFVDQESATFQRRFYRVIKLWSRR